MVHKSFYWIFTLALIAIYLVILAGSIVRMTGSGMGCPDWPKCFNQWIPPTAIEQLPGDYTEIFLDKRKRKLEKYTSFLNRIGMSDIAVALSKDPDVLKPEPFVASKTWIEYINRLMGFMAGNFLLIGFFMSFLFWKTKKSYVVLSFLALLFTSIQGWFGSIVVTSNLTPWTISFHMLFALLIIAVIVLLIKQIRPSNILESTRVRSVACIVWLLSLIQIYFGTQVRQEIDVLVKSDLPRSDWIHSLSSMFEIHRSFAILVILIHIYLFVQIKDNLKWRSFVMWMIFLLIIEVLSGIIMAYFSVPQLAQPAHLFLATVLFGMQFWLLLHSKSTRL